jgi:UPF0042 nucleotide-binding protein
MIGKKMKNLHFLIVTGLSGSGKSGVINVLEDNGYYCIDNIPPQLIPGFAGIAENTDGMLDHIALVVDIRGGELFKEFDEGIAFLKKSNIDCKILFLDASDEVLVRRYKETRRRHPLDTQSGGSIKAAVELERAMLGEIRDYADYYLDTSETNLAQLKESVAALLFCGAAFPVKITSFGFKAGISLEADLVFDVRCLPNPFYIPELKHKTGLDLEVRKFVMNSPESLKLLEKLLELIDYSLPLYKKEGKSQLIISFGCTGGKHRSVTFAELTAAHLREAGYNVMLSHRDIKRIY